MKSHKFYIRTYGCQMNVADSELVAGILSDAGYKKADTIDNADIIIFNSCTVRQHAEDRVLGRITAEATRKEQNPNILIGLIGCVAQRKGEGLLNEIKSLDFVVGTDQYRQLPEIISSCMNSKEHLFADVQNNIENYENIYPVRSKGVNAFVTIMRGCNNFCSYCIVPYVRGRERSRDHKEILFEIEQAGNDGFKDITLLGQNVNSYNDGKYTFPELLKEAARVSSIERLRFVTSHPKDISDKVINVMAAEPKLCEHLHLPMQSGSDRILEKMNRKYTPQKYLNIIHKLRNAMPNIAITTDVMVGFPGETEDDFIQTYNLMKEIRFDYAFMFKYSPREGTAAAEYPDQIQEEIRLARLQKLIDQQERITYEKYQEQIGRRVQVYVEKTSKKSDKELSGRTRDNKIAVFPGDSKLIGTFVDIEIVDATGWTLKGKQIQHT